MGSTATSPTFRRFCRARSLQRQRRCTRVYRDEWVCRCASTCLPAGRGVLPRVVGQVCQGCRGRAGLTDPMVRCRSVVAEMGGRQIRQRRNRNTTIDDKFRSEHPVGGPQAVTPHNGTTERTDGENRRTVVIPDDERLSGAARNQPDGEGKLSRIVGELCLHLHRRLYLFVHFFPFVAMVCTSVLWAPCSWTCRACAQFDQRRGAHAQMSCATLDRPGGNGGSRRPGQNGTTAFGRVPPLTPGSMIERLSDSLAAVAVVPPFVRSTGVGVGTTTLSAANRW